MPAVMIGAYAGCVHHRHMVLPKMACLRPFQPVPGCGRGLHQGPSKRGAAGLEPASASGSAIELHPLRTAINPSANARPIRVSFVWAKRRPETIHGSAAAGTSPATTSTTESSRDRGHLREWFAGGAGFEPATYGSKDRRAAKLHHPPICRFARPPTRWTPSAGPDVTDTARHCDHPQTLAVPRQGGCRGDPPHGSGARRVPHARRVAYLAYPPGIRTWISTHRGRRAAITPTGHSHPNQTGCKAGMPDSISPAAPRYGVRKLRFKRTVRWVTNPAVKPGRALPSIP